MQAAELYDVTMWLHRWLFEFPLVLDCHSPTAAVLSMVQHASAAGKVLHEVWCMCGFGACA